MTEYKVFDKGKLRDIITYTQSKQIKEIKNELIAEGLPKTIEIKFYRKF